MKAAGGELKVVGAESRLVASGRTHISPLKGEQVCAYYYDMNVLRLIGVFAF